MDISELIEAEWRIYVSVNQQSLVQTKGLSPDWRQAIIWTKAGILFISPLETNVNGIVVAIHAFSFNKMHLDMSSGNWRPFCFGLNVVSVTCSTLQVSFPYVWLYIDILGWHLFSIIIHVLVYIHTHHTICSIWTIGYLPAKTATREKSNNRILAATHMLQWK